MREQWSTETLRDWRGTENGRIAIHPHFRIKTSTSQYTLKMGACFSIEEEASVVANESVKHGHHGHGHKDDLRESGSEDLETGRESLMDAEHDGQLESEELTDPGTQMYKEGEYFGEENMLGLREEYPLSIFALEFSGLIALNQKEFMEVIGNDDDLLEIVISGLRVTV